MILASPSRGRLRTVGAVLVMLVLLLGAVPAAAATGSRQDPGGGPPSLTEGRFFGPELDWSADSARAYADRAGITPSFFSRPVAYPIDAQGERDLLDLVRQEAPLGSVAVVSLEPSTPLEDLTAADAEHLAGVLEGLSDDFRTSFFLRFAPEMNGTWLGWGQQPDTYVDAFRTVAGAVHAEVPSAAMVWAPSYAAGYPFTEAYGAVKGLAAGTVTAP
jgi:hypothetical protein